MEIELFLRSHVENRNARILEGRNEGVGESDSLIELVEISNDNDVGTSERLERRERGILVIEVGGARKMRILEVAGLSDIEEKEGLGDVIKIRVSESGHEGLLGFGEGPCGLLLGREVLG